LKETGLPSFRNTNRRGASSIECGPERLPPIPTSQHSYSHLLFSPPSVQTPSTAPSSRYYIPSCLLRISPSAHPPEHILHDFMSHFSSEAGTNDKSSLVLGHGRSGPFSKVQNELIERSFPGWHQIALVENRDCGGRGLTTKLTKWKQDEARKILQHKVFDTLPLGLPKFRS
jgi:hypothetical protein